MKKIPASVERLLKRVGEPVTIKKLSDSFYEDDSSKVETYALIDTQSVSVGAGQWDRALVATIPNLNTDITGATLTRKKTGETFQVSVYEKTYAGGNVAMQEVILKAVS
jgi:hypothetical protein